MANEILVTRGLTKRYGNHLAVDHVELSIQEGQIYGWWAATARARPRSFGW